MPVPDVRAVRFLAVGVLNTLVGLALIYGSQALLGLGDVAANGVGYALAMGLGFTLNRQWTFQHRGPAATAFMRYGLVLLAAYGANLAAVLIVRDALHVPGALAQLAGVAPYALTAWLGSRHFAFAARPA